jgi:hypothetical protein
MATVEAIGVCVEAIALIGIFIWDRIDASDQHKQTIAQMKVMQNQTRATEIASNAASKSAEALINSERAWIIAELVPQAARVGNNLWVRLVGDGRVLMDDKEIVAGHHLRYKLKLTNMGRTPAQLFYFTIRYSCLGKGVTDLPENAGGNETSFRSFEHLLGSGESVEIAEIIDLHQYMGDDRGDIDKFEKTAVIHGEVKYHHIFSSADDWLAEFCYSYTASEQRLTKVGRRTKQRQERAGETTLHR